MTPATQNTPDLRRTVWRAIARPRVFIPLFLFLLYELALFFAFRTWNPVAPKDLVHILGRFQAKQICSCVFVQQQSEAFCVDLVKDSRIPNSWITREVDNSKRLVRTQSIFSTASAVWIDAHSGCRFVDSNSSSERN